MINWCCISKSVISDIETDHIEIKKPTSFTIPGYKK